MGGGATFDFSSRVVFITGGGTGIGKGLGDAFAATVHKVYLLVMAIAVVTLALGIGVNTTIFSMVNGLIFSSLHIEQQGQIRQIGFRQNTLGQAAAEALVDVPLVADVSRLHATLTRDAEGYLTYVGRMDDVFKSSGYRISPFELESVLIEHPAVAEAAVVPSPDALRLAVPKAFLVLAGGAQPDAATARSILEHVSARVSPYKRIRRLEFAALPKTISGKIRRVDLRKLEEARGAAGGRRPQEFWEEDLKPKADPAS